MGFLSNRADGEAEESAHASGVDPEAGTNGTAAMGLVRTADKTATEGELDRIRELLFGVEIGTLREDLERIDNQVAQQSGEVRELISRRLDTFERNVQIRLDKMDQRLDTESRQRLEAYSQLEDKIETKRTLMGESVESLGARIDESHSSLTSQLHGQGKLFSDAIRRHFEELSHHFEREAEALAQARADRSAVAKVLQEMARQLVQVEEA